MLDKVFQFFKWAKGVYEGSKVLQTITTIVNIATVVVGVKGFLQARQMLAKGQDILANKTSAGGKIPVIYGTRRVGAQVVYMDVSNNDSRHLFVVYALSVGEVDEILGRTIQLDGNPLTDSARFRYGCYVGSDNDSSLNTVSQVGSTISAGAGGFGTSSTSRYRITLNLHHGAATQTADPMLVASMPNWTTAHKLNGIAYIAAHFKYDKEGMFAGVPQLTVQVRGKKVYDPRLDSTAGGSGSHRFDNPSTYAYSDNPALCFLNLISDNEYGKGLTEAQLNMSTFSSAANVCDTLVDQPYFNGTAQSLTWSGTAGDDFITISGSSANQQWWQNKIGETVSIFDSNGDDVIDEKDIKDIQRNEFYDENAEYIVYINDTLGSTYSSQTGTSLAKVKRFHCNGYLDTNKNVMDNAKELLANMRGIFLYIDGKYELQIEDTGSSTFTITDDHIIADAGISVDYGNKDKKANKVIVEFFNANKRYELDTATVLHDATPEYYSDDNDEILEIKAEFPYVTDPYIAYNMAKAILVRSRKQMTIQFLGTPEMYKLNVGDIVTLNYVGTFDTSQTCRVEALELQPNGLVAVSLIEYFDVYTWETPPEEPLEELANLPSAYAVKAPTGLSFTDTDSSSTGRPFLSWNEPTDFPDYQYRVNVVDSSSNQVLNRIVDVENCDLNFLPVDSNYVASVTSLNVLGSESDAATLTFTIGDAPTATADIKNDAITTPKILDNNVTDAKINSLTANKLTAGTIDASVITVTNLDADNITSGTIGADKILVDDLSAINSDLGAIDAGSINIGSGAFTVTSAGVLDATGATIGGSFSSGSGNSIFKADTNGIYLGNATFANAPFKVLSSGEVQTTKSFTAGVAGTDAIAKMDGSGDYRFWSGNETPSNASFSVDKDGKVIAKNLVLKLTDGTVYFDSDTGFSSSAISQISANTGTKVSTVSSTFDADTEYEEITVTSTTSVNVSVSIDTNFGGTYGNATENTAIDEAEQKVPENFTLTIEHSSDGGSTYSTVVTDTFTRVNDRQNPKTTPLSDEYKINTTVQELFISGGGGVIYLATTTTSLNLGSVDSDGRTTLSYTGLSLSGTASGTTHRIRASVSTTDTNYDTTNNNVSSTTPRVLSVTDPSGNGFYVDDGTGSTVPPEGDITAVQITTASNSGLTGGANFTSGDATFTLALASNIDGAKTFTNNVVIQGDLDVQGTTTTIDTTNLDVKDKNITLNYGTSDTSANANGAGITIQDAVSAGNDATLTWNTSNDSFNFSHPVNVTGAITSSSSITASGGLKSGGSNNYLLLDYDGDFTGANYFAIQDTSANRLRISYAFSATDNLELDSAGNFYVNGGNATIAGTINSGVHTITSSGTIGGSNIANAYLKVTSGSNTLGFDPNEIHTTSTLYLNSEAGQIRLRGDDGAGTALYNGATQFMSSALNLFNIGTISSDYITADHGILATDIWINNNQPATDNAIFSGYGAIGNRSTFYITNSGTIQIGNGTTHNSDPTVFFNSTGLNMASGKTIRMNGTTVIDSSINLTNIATVDADTLKANDSGTTPTNCKLHVGAINNTGSSAIAQFGGFIRAASHLIVHSAAGASDSVYMSYTGGNVDFRTGEGAGANSAVVVNSLKVGTTTVIDSSRNLINIPSLNVNHASNLSGTQVYIKRQDTSTNLQRWGEGTSGADTYRFRIDQNFRFIGNSGAGGSDVITIDSANGNINTSGAIVAGTIEGYTFPSYPSQSGGVLTSDVSGNMAWSFNTVSSYVDSGDNRVVTSTGSTGIQGEYGLTYSRGDGLTIHNYGGTGGLSSVASLYLGQSSTGSGISNLTLDSQVQGFIFFKDGTTTDASIGYEGVFSNKLSISCSNGINFGSSNLETTGTINSNAIDSLTSSADIPQGSTANLYLVDTRSVAANTGGSIVFSGYYQGTTALNGGSYIKGYKENATSGDYGFGLKFGVRENGQGISDPVFTLNSSGNAIFTGNITATQGYRQATAGNDGLRVFGGNANQPLIRVSANNIANNSADYGFTLAYRGDRTGNENSLAIYSDNQTGSQVEAINIKQDGTTNFASNVFTSGRLGINGTDDANAQLILGDTTGVWRVYPSGNNLYVFDPKSGLTNRKLFLQNTGSGGTMDVDINGNFQMNNTTVIDSSRNIRNVPSAAFTGGSYAAGIDSVTDAGIVLTRQNKIYSLTNSNNYLRNIIEHNTNNHIIIGQFGTSLIADIYLQSGSSGTIFFNTNGSTSTGAKVDSGGNFIAQGNVTAYGSVSDIRRKENVEIIPDALEKLKTLDGITFNFKDKPKERMTGVIAQQVEKILPEAVYETTTMKDENTKAVHYGNMVGLLIEAIKDQQQQIDELKARLDNDSSK